MPESKPDASRLERWRRVNLLVAIAATVGAVVAAVIDDCSGVIGWGILSVAAWCGVGANLLSTRARSPSPRHEGP